MFFKHHPSNVMQNISHFLLLKFDKFQFLSEKHLDTCAYYVLHNNRWYYENRDIVKYLQVYRLSGRYIVQIFYVFLAIAIQESFRGYVLVINIISF